jgi:hypothetical protein
VDWHRFLEEALRHTRCVVAVYSQTYFAKETCQWELHEAHNLKLTEAGRFIPVLIDPGAAKKIPYIVQHVNWIPTSKVHWIDEVRKALGLRVAGPRPVLRFATLVTDVVAGHTLPPLTVTGFTPEGTPPWPAGGVITIAPDPPASRLTGTLTRTTTQDTVVFSDLAFQEAAAGVKLIAISPGCEPATTPPFEVTLPEEQPHPADRDSDRPSIPTGGRPVFFPEGQALAVYEGRTLTIYTAAHEAAARAELNESPRLWARGQRCLAVADWSARVVRAAPDGTVLVADLPASPGARLNVPGALAFDEDTLYIGMWGGAVWRLPIDANKPEQVFDHAVGVQVLLADPSGFVVGDLEGKLTRYRGDGPEAGRTLESLLLAITRVRDFALIVGEHRIHRLDLTTGDLLQVTQPVTEITDTVPSGELATIIDAAGRCVSFDAELAVRHGFQTVPGASLAESGKDGRLLVLRYPDGTHALVRDSRTTYISRNPMAISPDGCLAAVSDGERLLILPPEDLDGGGQAAEEKEMQA